MSLVDLTKTASVMVDDIENRPREVGGQFFKRRTPYSVLTSTMSELGELAEEVMIDQGNSYKKAGADGIVGEAIDTIVCLLDLIHVVDPTITSEDLDDIAFKKLDKWVTKVGERK